jgi:tetratricopeptide (TPR) repeat protein
VADTGYATDFFVSHADADTQWAEWIAAELERAGYKVIVKTWDFRPGENSLARLDEALAACRHTLCVLSPDYVDSEVAARTAAHHQDLQGKERALIPVRVKDCAVPPLMGPYIQVDLSGTEDEEEARRLLLDGVAQSVPRVARGGFPKSSAARARFPLVPQEAFELRGHRPDPYFTGRDGELATLYRAFRAGSPTAAVQAVTGLGGLGKTRLAVEYAYRHAAAYGTVWWVRAEDPATMRGDYVELAQALGLPCENDSQAIAALRADLRKRRDWLLIFDNAEDANGLFALLPDRHPGHVLITSRRREWPHTESHHLDNLPAPAAVDYLQRRGGVADAGRALDLAEALGRLPLALVQAASVIASGMPVADYLDELHKQSPELFAEGRAADHELTIDSTWRVSVDRLAQRSPAAVALFQLAAFLAAEAIPVSRLAPTALMPTELADALSSRFQLHKATAALGEYSLAETAEGLLSIHRMVQAVTRADLGDDAAHWAGLALGVIAEAFPRNVTDPGLWDDCERFLAHALACTGHAGRLRVEITTTVQLIVRVTEYLLARGRIDSAAVVLAPALSMAEQFSNDDPVYLSCRTTYGALLFDQGSLPAAREVREEVYQASLSTLGFEHPDTLRAGRDLVEVLYAQGHMARAARLQDQVTEASITLRGLSDLETITSLAYQATILNSNGEYTRARAIQEQVLETRRQALGEEHPDTLVARLNLSATLFRLGKRSDAQAMQEQVVEARTRLLGDEHPNTLGAKIYLASTLFQQGDVSQARAMQEQVLKAQTRLLGDEHHDTLVAKLDLASTLFQQGDLSQAREMTEQALEALQRVLGADQPETLRARAALATVMVAQGELQEAISLLFESLTVSMEVFGKKHTATTEAAWQLLGHFGAQETVRRRAFIMQYLSWLGTEPSAGLTAEQKKIRDEIKLVIYVGKKKPPPKKPPARKRR